MLAPSTIATDGVMNRMLPLTTRGMVNSVQGSFISITMPTSFTPRKMPGRQNSFRLMLREAITAAEVARAIYAQGIPDLPERTDD